MNRKVLVVTGVVLLSLASCCGVCMLAGLVDGTEGAPTGLPDGRYDCALSGRMMSGSMLQVTSTASISFTLNGDAFSTQSGRGTVRRAGNVLVFSGSDMNDWKGTVSGTPEDPLIYFRAKPTELHPGGGAGNGETRCEHVD